MLNNFRIILVRTTHAGNIGATARAMKTMGLTDLVLVAPENYTPQYYSLPDSKITSPNQAMSRAAGANDVLESARVVESLEEAIADCHFVAGTSTRQRSIPWPHLSLAQAAPMLFTEAGQSSVAQNNNTHKVAIVFGREEHGLTNTELALCSQHISIDANPDYPVMNLAAAVQVVCYTLRQQSLIQASAPMPQPINTTDFQENATKVWDQPRATMDELEKFYQHFEQTLLDLDYMKADEPRQLMTRIRRLFNRALPDKLEISLLRGMLAKSQKASKKLH